MKLKILVIPVVIIVTIVLLIWTVFPAYFEMREEMKQNDILEKKMNELQDKSKRAEILSAELDSNMKKKEILDAFIPENVKEEDMINNMAFLSEEAGATIYSFSIEKNVEDLNDSKVLPNEKTISGEEGAVAAAKPVVAEKAEAKLGVIGSYDQIKSLLGKIYSLQRFSQVTGLKIERQNQDSPDILKAEIELTFYYLKNNVSSGDSSNEIFNTGKFNMSVISEIESKTNTTLRNIDLGQFGKRNLFLPQ